MVTMRKTAVSPGSHLLTVLLVTWLNPSLGNLTVTPSPPNPKSGNDVTFIVTGIEGGNIRFTDWYRGGDNNADNQILRFTVRTMNSTRGKQYIEGAKGFANGSMLLSNAQTAHSGIYTVDIQTGQLLQGKVELRVQAAPLSGGAIAGIVIAVLVVVTGAILLIYCFSKNKQSANVGSSSGSSKDGSQTKSHGGASASDLQYAPVST